MNLNELSYFQLIALHWEVSWKLFWPSFGIVVILILLYLFIAGAVHVIQDNKEKHS